MTERARIHKLLTRLNRQKSHDFPDSGSRDFATKEHGVYLILNNESEVLHVGRTYRGKLGLRQRLRNHLSGASSFVKMHFGGRGARLRKGHKYKYLEVADHRERALLECLATAWHCPRHLGVHEKNPSAL